MGLIGFLPFLTPARTGLFGLSARGAWKSAFQIRSIGVEDTEAVRRCGRRATEQGGIEVEPVEGGLTPREVEVLALVARGLDNEEIAAELCVEMSTVRTYVKRTKVKVGAPTRTHLAIYVFEHGIMRPRVTPQPEKIQKLSPQGG